MSNGIIIFAKNPEIGKAKTRIAASVGNEEALSIYNELLAITRRSIDRINVRKYLFYTHFINKGDAWSNDNYVKKIQVSGSLGERMKSAFSIVLGSNQKAIIIGSDCPYITEDIIAAAFKALDSNDVVIGPTYDGGYYLLGMKKLIPELFDRMVFSTTSVYHDTLQRINKLSLSYQDLPKLNDVDYYEDWLNYKASLD